MVMHVKEPQPFQYDLGRAGQIVFTYLHLAADEPQANALMKAKPVTIESEPIEKNRQFTTTSGTNEQSCWPYSGTGGC